MKLKTFGMHHHVNTRNAVVAFSLLLPAGMAMAQAMPWDAPLCGLAGALRGPTALAVSTIAFFAAGASFLWGEEIAGISKKLVTIFMAIAILIGGATLVGWIAVKMGAATTSCTA